MLVPSKVTKRIANGLKKYQRVIKNAYSNDVNESDTAVIVTDFFSDLLGYDKYTELTTETAIRGTYCDLAVSIKNRIKLLLELKAVGVALKEQHVKQAIDYAANKGIDWVVLSNARQWQVYKVSFGKPINKKLIFDFDITLLNVKSEKDIEQLYALTKEGLEKSALNEYFDRSEATNKYLLGNLVLADQSIKLLKREIKKFFPKIKISLEEISETLQKDVIKRDVLDDNESSVARTKIKRRHYNRK